MKVEGRVEPHDHQTLAYFVEDIPGGVLVECQHCKSIDGSFTKSGESEYCTNCKWELLYPERAEW